MRVLRIAVLKASLPLLIAPIDVASLAMQPMESTDGEAGRGEPAPPRSTGGGRVERRTTAPPPVLGVITTSPFSPWTTSPSRPPRAEQSRLDAGGHSTRDWEPLVIPSTKTIPSLESFIESLEASREKPKQDVPAVAARSLLAEQRKQTSLLAKEAATSLTATPAHQQEITGEQ